ncbi:helix-turn-helix domain-containing protein [Actinoplanes sp. ATCC 53533]|uniref:helix-turn-helix domain-containing protein n=1 Tax=Actinoplanes sp. ATCC 53533 TaxID=1288362 RepID=UPI0018F41845|nr:helix-turn-helix domain-containing protein [Actinoplanes sp. ATCC 53533]
MGTAPLSTAVPVGRILQRAAANLRADIDKVAEDTMDAIGASIPEYARPADETYRRTLRAGVEQALYGFLGILEKRDDTTWRDVYRAIGVGEMREGRSLDALQAAIRIGARIGLRHFVEFAESESLTATTVGSLADAIWAHVDDLADAATDGYAEARAAEVGELDRRRRRLLDLLVADPPAAEEAIGAAAAAARWQVPRRLAAIALAPGEVHATPPMLPPDVLADLNRVQPALIVPDPKSPAQIRLMVNCLRRFQVAVGPAVPPGAAGDSLRWARRALDLAGRGLIAGDGVIWCDDHLATLTIFQDEALLAVVVERRLGPLTGFRENQREPLADTLLSWLQHNMNANAVAADLHLHPQTVRRRLRQLDRLFGDQIHDSDARFELEIALRAERAGRVRKAQPTKPAEPPQPVRQAEPAQRTRQTDPAQRTHRAEQAVAPRHTEPAEAPRRTEPAVAPRRTEPAVAPRRAEPAVAPRRADRVTRPAVPGVRRAR